jgi:hypothetical protein
MYIPAWKPNVRTSEAKFHGVVTACTVLVLNFMEMIKCNNYEVKKMDSFKYLGSNIVTKGREQ